MASPIAKSLSPPFSPSSKAKAKSPEPEPAAKITVPDPDDAINTAPTKSCSPPPPTSAKTKARSPELESEPKILNPKQDDSNKIIIDMEVLSQILELDEEDNHEFSKGIVWDYFDQAVATFDSMDTAFVAKDLRKLSELGHFLKGSSAAVGVQKVQLSCERIQHYGNSRDEEAMVDLSDEEALEKIESTLAVVKSEYRKAELWLRAFYKDPESSLVSLSRS